MIARFWLKRIQDLLILCLIGSILDAVIKNKVYDKKLIEAIIAMEPRLSKKYLKEMYRYTFDEKIPFNEVRDLFAKIDELNLNIPTINLLSYKVLKQVVDKVWYDSKIF